MCSAGSQLAQDRHKVQLYQEWKSARFNVLDGVLDRKGFLFMTNKWVRSKFLTVLSCQLFDIVYISVSWLMSGASNCTPLLFEDCGIWHVTMVTKKWGSVPEFLFTNLTETGFQWARSLTAASILIIMDMWISQQKYAKLLALKLEPTLTSKTGGSCTLTSIISFTYIHLNDDEEK